MRLVTVAVVSFVLGAVSMFLWGAHTSMFPASVYAQVKVPPRDRAAIPVVPSVHHTMAGGVVSDMGFSLDGMDAKGTVFTNVAFEYGGGAYRLESATIVPPINVTLTGAAANTAAFLSALGLLGCPTTSGPPKPEGIPNQAINKTSPLHRPVKGNFLSPFGQ